MTNNNLYHKIRKFNPELAREIVREKLIKNKGNRFLFMKVKIQKRLPIF